jgi:hypothetical protein
MRQRLVAFLLLVLVLLMTLCAAVFLFAELSFPSGPPDLEMTYNLQIQPAPLEIGSFDVMGVHISRAEAQELLQSPAGQLYLSRTNGAIEITEELIELGRETFYLQTFGNEVFLTDVVGVMDGPINLWTFTRAILGLRGGATTNLRIPVDDDIVMGGRTFPAGSHLDTGLDVPAGWLLPIGMRLTISQGNLRVGVTCAMCHVSLDPESGLLIEGATNTDIDTGLILAMASNSAAMFRHTDVDPRGIEPGQFTYVDGDGQVRALPDPSALEAAVDEAFLGWSPGTFDATADLVSNPTFIQSSFTFGQWPYGWNGFGSVGWFQGLTTLNNNVHAVSADNTTDAALIARTLEIDEETYLALLLQNASSADWRLPQNSRPSEFFKGRTPTPHHPGIIEVVVLPGYPNTSYFAPFGLVASSFGLPVAEELNAMSAYQNRLAPPTSPFLQDLGVLQRGAQVFEEAGCAECHAGRHFSNNSVIPVSEIGTQPARALGLEGLDQNFQESLVYPPDMLAPVMPGSSTLVIPMDVTPQEIRDLAYAVDGEGGYKVVTLIGIYLQAPYLHDAGVAASAEALRMENGRFVIADDSQIGLAGTLMRGILPDPEASLRMLLDRQLREAMIQANRAHPDLQRHNVDGTGHEFWVDEEAGFSGEQQSDLIWFLLSLDDDPPVLPESSTGRGAGASEPAIAP